MAIATFDTLKFASTRKAAGVPEKQAEAVAFGEVMQINFKELGYKEDLNATRDELKQEMNDIRIGLKQEINDVEQRLMPRSMARSPISRFRSRRSKGSRSCSGG